MFCCPNCFTHAFLKDHIKNYSKQKGKCSFCNYKGNQPLYKPAALIDWFQPLFDLYVEGTGGRSLAELLQFDWNVFSKIIDKKKQSQLISKIAGVKGLSSKRFISTLVQNNELLGRWDDFTNELKHKNRFFPKKIDAKQLAELFSYLTMSEEQKPKYVFRARINHQSKILPLTKMGKPPRKKSTDGRANPKGISYFYGASDEITTIAEARPYKTEIVCVAKYKVDKKISLIDLRDPKSTTSPFDIEEDILSLLYIHMPFLGHLSEVLSKPVLPHEKEMEYLPTQYLCELIKNYNFNGIAFKSSLEEGDNFVIFNDSFLSGIKVEGYIVSDTKVKSKKLSR
jgi:transposase-like protein